MLVRVILLLLLAAVAWSLGVPNRVVPGERRARAGAAIDPDAYADAMGLPEVFDLPEADGEGFGIDPEPHRAALEQIEAILYRRGPTGYGDAEAVEGVATRLALAVMAEGLAGRRAGAELLAFAGGVGARTDVGYALPSLVDLRREWEAVRARVFAPAGFLRTAGPGLDAVQEPAPPAMDPRATTVLRDAEGELHRLLRRGQRDVERLGEPVYDPDVPGRSDLGQIRAWHDWGEHWRHRLDVAMAPVRALSPAPHPQREPLHDDAVRALRDAHDALRRIPEGAGMWPTPFRPTWESHFRHASASLAHAREILDRPETRSEASAEAGTAPARARR